MNRVRGDAPIVIDGVERRLRLTFGALAEIECGLDVESLADLGARLAKLSAADLKMVLAALLRGGGEDETAARIGEARVDLGAAAKAVFEAFGGAAQ
jgi:hypothetical protein